ncbi:MAG: Uma2 family endonuclease [Saprospiraceae bacterium]
MTAYIDQFKFTVEEYYKLAEVGIIKDSDHVELIDGQIVTMSPIKSFHAGIVNRIVRLLSEFNGKKILVSPQNPIHLSTHSEPEPDIIIAKFKADDYISEHPTPEDIYCLIEVSDTTLLKDREIKQPLYAKANIPEYWIINLVDKQIEIFRQPKNGEYHFRQIISEAGVIRLEALNLELQYGDVFN